MIKFFKRVRLKFLAEGENRKYFKYAIGEIVLVVIGILIALQINNWNENRKLHSKSLDYLHRLKVDLDNVLEDVNGSVIDVERKYNQSLVVLDALEAKELITSKREDFENYLKQYYRFQITIQNTPAYNEMLSSGDLGLIKNEGLRTAFANLADFREFIMEVNRSNHNAYKINMELIEKHIRYHFQNRNTDSTSVEVTYDFNAMMNDDLFINHISNQSHTWKDILRLYERLQSQVNNVRDSVLIELEKFD